MQIGPKIYKIGGCALIGYKGCPKKAHFENQGGAWELTIGCYWLPVLKVRFFGSPCMTICCFLDF